MNIKGFRPGKAPREIVENTVGKEKLWEEAAKTAIKESYPKIVQEKNLFAVSQPRVEIVSAVPEGGVVYKAEVYIMPEIKLPDYKKISSDIVKKERKEVKAEEKEIDDAINTVRESRAKNKRVEREAQKGDSVTINFAGVFEDDSEKKIEEKNFQIVLGTGGFDMLQGFEDNIMGMKEGEKKEFPLEVSLSKEDKKKVNFEVEMISVMEREVPEANDEFAASLTNVENMQQLKEKVKEGIESQKKAKEEERVRLKVLEGIKSKVDFEIPEVLVEKEIDHMVENLKHQVSQNGVSFEDYLKDIKKSEEDLRNDWKKKAEENVGYAILLYKIGEGEGIEVSGEEVEEEVDKHLRAYGKDKNNEKEEVLEKMRSYSYDAIKNRKVFEVLSLQNDNGNN